jgi:hypothetical protein
MGHPHLGGVAKERRQYHRNGLPLLAAKADPKMQHGEWGTMVESDLPFNRHTAHKLMQIARDKRLTNVSQGKHLPPSWTTLYELTKLDDDTFDQKLRDGSINPEMQHKDVARAPYPQS